MKIHIVQKGDTLWKIAKKYGVNFEELKKMNSQLSNPDMIMPGMKIKVPTAGGSVKKEAPIGQVLGAKKEMPKAEQPFVKEQPKPLPVVEAPQKEAPVMPIKEAPVMPKKEAPIAHYTPVVPQPVIPEIDINNYYMLNMANMNIQQPPQLPPKPTNILPEAKEMPKELPIKEAPIMEVPKEESPLVEAPIEQAMPEEYCVPVSPILPGSGLQPGWCPPQPCLPFQHPFMLYQQQAMPQVQGVMNPGMMPGVENPTYLAGMEDESSSFMPQMPMMSPMGHNPNAVMGVEDTQNVPQNQPMGLAPTALEPGFIGPFPDNCVPASPVLPGPGLGEVSPAFSVPYGAQQMPYGGSQIPFGAQQMPYGGGQVPFGSQQMPYGGAQVPFGSQQMPYGGGQAPFGSQQMPYEGGQMPFGSQQMPYGGGQVPFGSQQMPYGGGQMPFGSQQMPYGGGQMPFGSQQMPYGGGQMPFGSPQMPFTPMPNRTQQNQSQPMENENNQMMMPQMPYGEGQMPMQQIPFSGGQMPMQQMPFGGGQIPMQQMPFGYGQMPFQQIPQTEHLTESPDGMGMAQFSPHMSQAGFEYDCGCGGPKFPKAPINPYDQGTSGVFTPQYGTQNVQPPYMNPYGFGQVPGPRDFDDSSDLY
ncbi:SafA/ExsA family spore coat assembly protein [Bacillus sp. CGMCC 1.16607]|uniref:SafA/ExsA family spore coat assembly protein n=1 Tax=Bacillus sp. CGMCC 1.16607 TaxID=3351842 RepID=UPI003636AD2C